MNKVNKYKYKFEIGDMVHATDYALTQIKFRESMIGHVTSIRNQKNGFIRVLRNGQRWPITWAVKFWEPYHV